MHMFNQNSLPFSCNDFSDDVLSGTRAGQPVTHMKSTNSKPQRSNQFPRDNIKSRPTSVLVQYAILI